MSEHKLIGYRSFRINKKVRSLIMLIQYKYGYFQVNLILQFRYYYSLKKS